MTTITRNHVKDKSQLFFSLHSISINTVTSHRVWGQYFFGWGTTLLTILDTPLQVVSMLVCMLFEQLYIRGAEINVSTSAISLLTSKDHDFLPTSVESQDCLTQRIALTYWISSTCFPVPIYSIGLSNRGPKLLIKKVWSLWLEMVACWKVTKNKFCT